MIGRRGFFGVLLGAPAVAKELAAEASGLGTVSRAGTVAGMNSPTAVEPYVPSALDQLFEKALRAHGHKIGAYRTRVADMPPSISGKKSWSPAFKQHVYRRHLMDTEDPYALQTDRAKRAFIRKIGLGDLL